MQTTPTFPCPSCLHQKKSDLQQRLSFGTCAQSISNEALVYLRMPVRSEELAEDVNWAPAKRCNHCAQMLTRV